ncbi:DNA-dependent metalloprotease WSS1, partial [Phenoliferia sp. Uapishka_3]
MVRGSHHGGAAGDCGQITVLKSQPKSDDALKILKKIHQLVKPIMRKHGWYLPTLAEFFPKQTNLLGINCNGGQKICIRLRPAHDPNSFLPLEDMLIGTMLHELSHNTRGPHDQIFYKQLDELQDEFDELQRNGYQGEGFYSKGTRVGEGVGHDSGMTMQQAREKALKTLEEKERIRKVLGKGGKLGGATPDMRGKRIGEILADAAERRAKDSKTCGGGHGADGSGASGSKQEDLPMAIQLEIKRAEEDGKTFIIDLTTDSDSDSDSLEVTTVKGKGNGHQADDVKRQPSVSPSLSRSNPDSDSDIEIFIPKKRSSPFPSSSSSQTFKPKPKPKPPPPPKVRPPLPPPAPSNASSTQKGWTCPTCTFDNISPLSLACEVCSSERPLSTIGSSVAVSGARQATFGLVGGKPPPPTAQTVDVSEGWYCSCGTLMEHIFWVCRTCGEIKKSSTRG